MPKAWFASFALLCFAAASTSVVTPACADLVIQTNTTSPVLITASFPESESLGIGLVPVTIGNTNVPNLNITIGTISTAVVAAGGDDGFDLVTRAGNTAACDNKLLLPSNTPFATAGANCTFDLVLGIGDADPTDKINPAVDFGEWFVNTDIPWTRADGAVSETLLTVDVKVFDDWEPPTIALLLTGLAGVGAALSRRQRA
jgi:hypothetical protein